MILFAILGMAELQRLHVDVRENVGEGVEPCFPKANFKQKSGSGDRSYMDRLD